MIPRLMTIKRAAERTRTFLGTLNMERRVYVMRRKVVKNVVP
jgi:hypothetical protein